MAAPRMNDDVQKMILDAAEDLLAQKSLKEVTLAQIADHANVAKGTVYYYFKNKEDILFAIFDRYLADQWKQLNDWTSNTAKDTRLPRLIKYVLARDIDKTGIRLHFIFEAADGNEVLRQKLMERYLKFEKEIAAKIQERQDNVDSDYLSWLALMVSDGLIIQKTLGNDQLDTDRFIAETEQYIRQIFKEEQNSKAKK
ncbi:MAG: TetR/AcrR family transcriptional regulator [Galactobacillus timonensis]|uniref:TetR/AcrR family transcriptional regulator n=1 Tax=Galactobacillus timonensis TaxID=2041840 RepID=UPI0023F10640|nr:TetR/AcrR family transcriptional regulator [Galactobacillus timonensis]MCI6067071.1 TetR/AcrR family transcriptional regulator [Galactobacillus timonensis]MCI6755058.1 TetR/AcrR family transcriptional regulator [Galactobacillus timonensis]MDD7086272.1 TetR/AcrR family transcriptional regulator [Galactobacillus timonensis]MDY5221937.1 TetR/AcrR family transcriptional regulator [Lachnospiraceae bacterium]